MIDDFLQKTKHRRLIIMVAPILGGFLLGGNFVVKPGLVKINKVKTDMSGLSQKESAFTHIAAYEQKIDIYKQKLSKEGDKSWLIEQLNAIADKAKFSILSINPDEKKSSSVDYFDRISVKIEAEGNFHQLGEFVSRVESLEQFIKILSIEIDKPIQSSELGEGLEERPSNKPGDIYNINLTVGLFGVAKGGP